LSAIVMSVNDLDLLENTLVSLNWARNRIVSVVDGGRSSYRYHFSPQQHFTSSLYTLQYS
jgi:hypothetical protein